MLCTSSDTKEAPAIRIVCDSKCRQTFEFQDLKDFPGDTTDYLFYCPICGGVAVLQEIRK